MSAEELFKSGKLSDAIEAQIQEVKSNPADQSRRLFLFELCAFAGDLERARRQVDVIKYDEVELSTALEGYKRLLDAEEKRRKLFADGLQPQFLLDPPGHVGQRLEALGETRAGRLDQAARLLEAANEAAAEPRGLLNDKPCAGLRDLDDVFGTVLEVMAHGDYYWLPLEQIASLAMNPPQFPRDLLWIPARLETHGGPNGDIFLPAIYPGTHEQNNEALTLGRMTDWTPPEEGPVRGIGLKSFINGEDVVPILEFRHLQLVDPAESGAEDPEAQTGSGAD